MKKLLFVLGLLFATGVNAEGLTMEKGQVNQIDCSQINLDKCYYKIDCFGYSEYEDRDYCVGWSFMRPRKLDVKINEVVDYQDGVVFYPAEKQSSTVVSKPAPAPVITKPTRSQLIAQIQAIQRMIALLQAQLAAMVK